MSPRAPTTDDDVERAPTPLRLERARGPSAGAAKLILDRGWGRSAPVIDAEIRETADLTPRDVARSLSDAELAAKLREQAHRLEASAAADAD